MNLGATGTIPDNWRGFAVGGGAADIQIVPLAADALFPGSPATQAARLRVTVFSGDQGFDHEQVRFAVFPTAAYRLEFYVRSANSDGSSQSLTYRFPLFDSNGNYLGRDPGHGTAVAGANWTRVVGPSFTDPQAVTAHVSFRVTNDGGDNAIEIALPEVQGPTEMFEKPTAAELAQRQTWTAADKLIGTSYFYWYRWPDRHFFFDAARTIDNLTDHFVSPYTVSMDSVSWHKQEIRDMMAAGIDMLWPVYWAAPGNFGSDAYGYYWTALGPLQTALDDLIAEGKSSPKVGMFYDTSSLLNSVRGALPVDGKADLTTAAGKELFYNTILSFFCNVKPKHWACIDGRPIVVLYTSDFVSGYDQSSFDYVASRFAADMGGITPYIIRDRSWNAQTDSNYRWGAAMNGPFLDGIAAVGPGYDDTGCPGRYTPIRLREDGNFYRWSWLQVLRSPARIVHVETWNEMHEGTDICESVEYGREYINLTAHYAAHFKAGTVPNETVTLTEPEPVPRPPNMLDGVEYTNARSVEIYTTATAKVNAGVDDRSWADGTMSLVTRNSHRYIRVGSTGQYGYFALKDPFYFDQRRRVQVTIEYLDEGTGTVQLQYDSHDPTALLNGAYKGVTPFTLSNTGQLRSWTATLEDSRFAGRQNGGTDLRLYVANGPVYIRRLRVEVLNLPEPVMRVLALTPAPGARVGGPGGITAELGAPVLASSVHIGTFKLLRSGGDGVFGNGNDVKITPVSYAVEGTRIKMNLGGLTLPRDTYQVILVGRGARGLRDLANRPLDGLFTGVFPSGDGTGGNDFVSTFTTRLRCDFDDDLDIDQEDFGRVQTCVTGPDASVAVDCDEVDYTGDGRVTNSDLLQFMNCMRGPRIASPCE